MSRYFFHSEDGLCYPDTEGTDLPDLTAVRIEAVRVMCDILREHAAEFWDTKEWKLTVTDDSAMTLFTLDMAAQLAPSMTPPTLPLGGA